MKLATAVMAHPSRFRMAANLAESLDAELVLDYGQGENHTGDMAWQVVDHGADWSIVLQDDAMPIWEFEHFAERALAHAEKMVGGAVVSFYVGTGRPRPLAVTTAVSKAEWENASWLEADTLLWGVAVAIPTDLVPAMLEYVQNNHMPYDQRIGAWARQASLPVLYTHPSLVDHRDGPRIATTGNPRPRRPEPIPPRHAHTVGAPLLVNDTVVRIAGRV